MFAYRSILFAYLAVSWGRIRLLFLFPGTFLQMEKKMDMLGLRGKTHGAKTETTRRTVTSRNLVCVCVCVWRSGWAVWWRPGVTVRLSETPGLPPAELSRGSSLPTGGTRGVIGRGLAVGWAVADPRSLAASHAVPPVPEGGGGSGAGLQRLISPLPPPACGVAAVPARLR